MDGNIENNLDKVKELIDDGFDKMFCEAHGIVDTIGGDIYPAQAIELENIKNKFSTLLIKQLKQNIPN